VCVHCAYLNFFFCLVLCACVVFYVGTVVEIIIGGVLVYCFRCFGGVGLVIVDCWCICYVISDAFALVLRCWVMNLMV